jgi:hypothetical protein
MEHVHKLTDEQTIEHIDATLSKIQYIKLKIQLLEDELIKEKTTYAKLYEKRENERRIKK